MGRQFAKRIAAFLFAVLTAATCHSETGQTYPNRPVRLVSAFPPGGATDIIARLVSQYLGQSLGQAVVVENKPGAGGAIGADAVAKAPADGYTLLIAGSSVFSTAPAFGSKVPFDSARDFAPIAELVETPRVLVVSATLPYKSVQEFVAAATEKPGALNYASNGIGGTVQMSSEAFKLATGTDITHVPYKGTSPALPAVSVPPGSKTFPLAALKSMDASDGIAPDAKEAYLSDADFATAFGMDRAAWAKVPKWKQADAKKRAGLF